MKLKSQPAYQIGLIMKDERRRDGKTSGNQWIEKTDPVRPPSTKSELARAWKRLVDEGSSALSSFTKSACATTSSLTCRKDEKRLALRINHIFRTKVSLHGKDGKDNNKTYPVPHLDPDALIVIGVVGTTVNVVPTKTL